MAKIKTSCVIIHKMIIEEERETPSPNGYDNVGTTVSPHRHTNRIQVFLEVYQKIEDRASHDQLGEDLTEHQWQLAG